MMSRVASDLMTRGSLELAAEGPRSRRTDAVALLTCYLFLLMAIPADDVLSPMGAAGGPSTLFALSAFFLYLGMWLRPGNHLDRGRQPIRLVGFLFTCVVVAAYASANRHWLPVLERNAADRGLMFMFGWLGILLVAADGIGSAAGLRTLLRRQVFGATAMALLGAVQFATGLNATNIIRIPGLVALAPITDLAVRGPFNRPDSTASHPIEFGAVLVMTLPFAIHLARFAAPAKRVRHCLPVGIIVMVIPMTVSRSAILGLLINAIVLLPTYSKRQRRVAYAIIAAALGAIWALVPGLVSEISGLFLKISSDPSAASRTKAVSLAWSYVAQHPWFGRGLGTFQPATYFFVDDQYVTSLIETGIVGVLALVMVFVAGWLIARGARNMTSDYESRSLGQSLAASVAVAAVSFSNYDALSFPVASGLTFLLLGCCGAYWRFARGDEVRLLRNAVSGLQRNLPASRRQPQRSCG